MKKSAINIINSEKVINAKLNLTKAIDLRLYHNNITLLLQFFNGVMTQVNDAKNFMVSTFSNSETNTKNETVGEKALVQLKEETQIET